MARHKNMISCLNKLESQLSFAEACSTSAMRNLTIWQEKLALWRKKAQVIREKIKEVKGE